jgi:hypothetical protein
MSSRLRLWRGMLAAVRDRLLDRLLQFGLGHGVVCERSKAPIQQQRDHGAEKPPERLAHPRSKAFDVSAKLGSLSRDSFGRSLIAQLARLRRFQDHLKPKKPLSGQIGRCEDLNCVSEDVEGAVWKIRICPAAWTVLADVMEREMPDVVGFDRRGKHESALWTKRGNAHCSRQISRGDLAALILGVFTGEALWRLLS